MTTRTFWTVAKVRAEAVGWNSTLAVRTLEHGGADWEWERATVHLWSHTHAQLAVDRGDTTLTTLVSWSLLAHALEHDRAVLVTWS